jgi:hypothetical protein
MSIEEFLSNVTHIANKVSARYIVYEKNDSTYFELLFKNGSIEGEINKSEGIGLSKNFDNCKPFSGHDVVVDSCEEAIICLNKWVTEGVI